MRNPIKMAIEAGKVKYFKKLVNLEGRRLAAIPVEKDGTRILATEILGGDGETFDDFWMKLPIEATPEAKKLKLVYRVKVPFYVQIPEEELNDF